MSASVTPPRFQPPEVPEDKARKAIRAARAAFLRRAGCGRCSRYRAAPAGSRAKGRISLAVPGTGSAARAGDGGRGGLPATTTRSSSGTGKAEVTPYASYYPPEPAAREILAGLARRVCWGWGCPWRRRMNRGPHGGLFEIMRHLISLGSEDASCNTAGFSTITIARSYHRLLPCNIGERKGQLLQACSSNSRSLLCS